MADTDMDAATAVLELTRLKGRAETAARAIHRFADTATRAHAAFAYGEGKAEGDALVAGLLVVVAGGEATDLVGLDTHLEASAAKVAALTERARAVLPPLEGARDVELIALLVPFLGIAEGVVAALWQQRRARDALQRKTIATGLEAARWADFDALAPS